MAERRVGAAVVHRPRRPRARASSPSATSCDSRRRRPGPRHRARRRPPDRRHRLRRARLVARGGRVAMVRGGFRHLVVVDGRRDRRASSRCATSCAAGPTTARSATLPARRSRRRAAPDGAARVDGASATVGPSAHGHALARERRREPRLSSSCSSGSSSMSRRVSRSSDDHAERQQRRRRRRATMSSSRRRARSVMPTASSTGWMLPARGGGSPRRRAGPRGRAGS